MSIDFTCFLALTFINFFHPSIISLSVFFISLFNDWFSYRLASWSVGLLAHFYLLASWSIYGLSCLLVSWLVYWLTYCLDLIENQFIYLLTILAWLLASHLIFIPFPEYWLVFLYLLAGIAVYPPTYILTH